MFTADLKHELLHCSRDLILYNLSLQGIALQNRKKFTRLLWNEEGSKSDGGESGCLQLYFLVLN